MFKRPYLLLYILIAIVILSMSIFGLFSLVTAPAPEQVRVTNIGSNSFTVSWLTAKENRGCVSAKVVGGQFKAGKCSETGATHLVVLTGFWPENSYTLEITSGLKTFRKNLPTVTTLPTSDQQPNPPLPAYGAVLYSSNTQPAVNALVYLADPNNPNAPVLATATNSQGGYSFDLSEFNPLPQYLEIEVVTPAFHTKNLVSTESFTPFPNLLLTINET